MARQFNPSTFFARIFLGYGVMLGALLVVITVANALQRSTVGRELEIGSRREYGGSAVDAATGAWASWNGSGSFGIREPSIGVGLVHAMPSVVVALAIALVSWWVFLVMVDVQLRVPFGPRSERRLKAGAVVAAGATVLYALLSAWADLVVFHGALVGETDGPSFVGLAVGTLVRASPALFVAALLAGFAQAFGEGQRLVGETEGLV